MAPHSNRRLLIAVERNGFVARTSWKRSKSFLSGRKTNGLKRKLNPISIQRRHDKRTAFISFGPRCRNTSSHISIGTSENLCFDVWDCICVDSIGAAGTVCISGWLLRLPEKDSPDFKCQLKSRGKGIEALSLDSKRLRSCQGCLPAVEAMPSGTVDAISTFSSMVFRDGLREDDAAMGFNFKTQRLGM